MDILRLATAGSVDDGKSTLIGRLLFDSKAIFEDQLASVERTSKERGEDFTNLALLTDGLRAEREQGITIDVAYRYFATPRRKFIIADTPGSHPVHAEHGDRRVHRRPRDRAGRRQERADRAEPQARVPDHAAAGAAPGARGQQDGPGQLRAAAFNKIVEEFTAFGTKLEIGDLTFIPISALHGDNVVERSLNMPWYNGPSLLHHLEHVHIASDRNLIDVRFPVQYVIRPHQATDPELHDYRGYAGQVAGGMLKPGDEVMHLPSGLTTRSSGSTPPPGPVDEAFPPMSVTLLLEDDLDISRGDMICRPHNQPQVTQDVQAMVSWMADAPVLTPRSRLVVKHTTRTVKAMVRDISYRLDINTLHRDESADRLGLNEIGRVSLRLTQPIFCDPYARNRMTGGMILIDEATSATVGAAMITEAGLARHTLPTALRRANKFARG